MSSLETISKMNSLTIEEINSLLSIDVQVAYNLREKLLKVVRQLDPISTNFVTNSFFLIEVINNIFTNCILFRKEVTCYRQAAETDIVELAQKIIDQAHTVCSEQMFKSDEGYTELFLDLIKPLISDLFREHVGLLTKARHNVIGRIEAIDLGKFTTITIYFSCITMLYGFRFLREHKKFILYKQPYYYNVLVGNKWFNDYVVDTLCKHTQIVSDVDLVISYRLCDPEYTKIDDKIRFAESALTRMIQLSNCFKQVYVAFIGNTTIEETSYKLLKEHGIIFDDDVDLYGVGIGDASVCTDSKLFMTKLMGS